ncbi:MAG: hypothetical protein LBS50_11210, partial [Prevotellaceae bacterium]|nr:hypothetical protein [Prevotellaceae bacterium]
ALKNLAQLKIQIDNLKSDQAAVKKAMDSTNTSTQKGAADYERLRQEYEKAGQEVKALTARSNEYQKTIQSNIKYEHEQEGSLQKLKAELSLNTQAYNKLSEAQKQQVGATYAKAIVDTTNKLKAAEQELGNFRRSVGDYSIAAKGLKTELQELTKKMIVLAVSGEQDSQAYKEAAERAGKLKDAMVDVKAEIASQGNDTAWLDGLTESIAAATAAYSAWQAATQLLGVQNEVLEETMQKLQIANVALNSLIQIQKTLQAESAASLLARNTLQKIGITQTVKENVVRALSTTITNLQTKAERGNIVTKAALKVAILAVTAAQWLWNLAVVSNPVLLLVAAIMAAIAAITGLVMWLNKSNKAQKAATAAQKEYEKQAQKTADTIEHINSKEKNVSNERSNRLRQEILDLQKNGATAEQIAKVKAKAEQDLRDIALKASKEREAAQMKELNSAQKNVDAQKAYLDTLSKGSKKYKEQFKNVNELIRAKNQLVQTINEEKQAQTDILLDDAEAQADKQKELVKKAQDNALKSLENQKKFNDEQAKINDTFRKNDFASTLKYDEDKFKKEQEYAKKRLDMQRKFNQVTAAEYKAQNELLAAQQETFNQNQFKRQQDHLTVLYANLQNLIGQSADLQIDKVKQKYTDLFAEIEKMRLNPPQQGEGQSDEDFKKVVDNYKNMMLNVTIYERELLKKQSEEIAAIRDQQFKTTLDKQFADIDKQYALEMLKFQDNAAEQLRIDNEIREKKKEAAKQAIEDEYNAQYQAIMQMSDNLASSADGEVKLTEEQLKKIADLKTTYNKRTNEQTAKDNAEARKAEERENELQLNRELLAAGNNETSKYEATKAFLEKQLELYKDNADKQAEIQQQITENEKEHFNQRIANFEEWSGVAMNILGAANEFANTLQDAELAKDEANNAAAKAALEKRLNAGLISQSQYDKSVAKMDADLDKKKKDMAIKQAKREKAMNIFSALLNTAGAIMKAISQFGPPPSPMGIVGIAAAAVLGGIQLATIAATPLPQAARGMLLKGKSHAQGGIPIEAEGGEAIINRRSTAMFAPLLSAINQAGGGVPFSKPYSDGGFSARAMRQNNAPLTAKEMQGIIKQTKIYTAFDDFEKQQDIFLGYTSTAMNY